MTTTGFMQRRLEDGIRGSAEALFPDNDLGAPDWRGTDIVTRTVAYLDELPPPQRRLIAFLFLFVELLAPFVLLVGLRRFSRLSVERRLRAVQTWRASRIYLIRVVGDALKAVMTMMYAAHPSVIKYMGMYAVCEHPNETTGVEVRPFPQVKS